MAEQTGQAELNINEEETLTVSHYSSSNPHAFIELTDGGKWDITLAGGGAGVSAEELQAWFGNTVRLLNDALNG